MRDNLTETLKDYAKEKGAALVGIAPAERLVGAPEGKRPADRLKDATCVVSLGVQVPQGVCETWGVVSHNPYRVYGHLYLNRLLHSLAYEVTLFLESEGCMALPFPPTISGLGGAEISHRHIAVAAGLGEFGWAGYVLTPEFGARQRFVSVITSAPLLGNPMYEGTSLCVPESCSFICVNECPMDALNMKKKKNCRIGGRSIEYTWIDRWRCSWAIYGLTTKVGGFKEIPAPPVIDEEAIERALVQKDPAQIRTEISQGGHATYCGKCQAVCPVGTTAWEEIHCET